jgi:hypothetical protein
MLFDPSKTPQVRNFGWQAIQYLRATINFNDPGIAGGVACAVLPQYAFVTSSQSFVETAFNAGTTNSVSLGTTAATGNEITGVIAGQTPGFAAQTAAAGLGCGVTTAGPVTVYAKYVQSGGAATAGKIHIVLAYVLNNDL